MTVRRSPKAPGTEGFPARLSSYVSKGNGPPERSRDRIPDSGGCKAQDRPKPVSDGPTSAPGHGFPSALANWVCSVSRESPPPAPRRLGLFRHARIASHVSSQLGLFRHARIASSPSCHSASARQMVRLHESPRIGNTSENRAATGERQVGSRMRHLEARFIGESSGPGSSRPRDPVPWPDLVIFTPIGMARSRFLEIFLEPWSAVSSRSANVRHFACPSTTRPGVPRKTRPRLG
jgi:hypothetical protein